MADVLDELKESYEYDTNAWAPIRKEAGIDMQYVAGNPWDKEDEKARKNRPSVAPEEMGQYFNQVINPLRANTIGMKFSPVGGGASEAGARFYQSKAREIEYRSHAKLADIAAAENAIQRGYGFERVTTRYASPRDANQELWIEGFPNPDMVMPDSDAKLPDSSDMKRCFVFEWIPTSQFKKEHPKAKITNFSEYQGSMASWVKGDRVLRAEYWEIATRQRQLLLVQPAGPSLPQRMIAPVQTPRLPPVQVFADELAKMPGAQVLRELREVDYPTVKMYLTNGLEILHEQDWAGKYIPIISCYGKVLYLDGGKGMERLILSMTRFGRAPWKSYSYCCSQQLEIIGQVPRTSVIATAEQLKGYEKDWEESPHVPKSYLLYNAVTPDSGGQLLPPPSRNPYMQGENLQALELVKEGFRRAIQAAMGSNFLPTNTQRRNEKSGVALDKIEQSASTGTLHFVDNFRAMVRRRSVIVEDLLDKIHDYQGETGVIDGDGTARSQVINTPGHPQNIDTKGDYLVTVSDGPSADSDQEAAEEFTNTLLQPQTLGEIAQFSGPKVAAAILAQAVRMRNLGPQGDKLADLISPPPPDGQKPPSPQEMQLQHENEQLKHALEQASLEKHAKVIEQQGKMAVVQEQEKHEDLRASMDREVKIAVAEITAQAKQSLQDMALFYEERARIGAHLHEQSMGGADAAHNVHLSKLGALHEAVLSDQEHQQTLRENVQQAALAPPDAPQSPMASA